MRKKFKPDARRQRAATNRMIAGLDAYRKEQTEMSKQIKRGGRQTAETRRIIDQLSARRDRLNSKELRVHMANVSRDTGKTADYDKMTLAVARFWNETLDAWERDHPDLTAPPVPTPPTPAPTPTSQTLEDLMPPDLSPDALAAQRLADYDAGAAAALSDAADDPEISPDALADLQNDLASRRNDLGA